MATPKPGSVVHIELHSAAPEKTQTFYERVFGWKFTSVPEMNYTTFAAPSPPHGGLMAPMEGSSPQVLNYLLSDDIAKTAAAIEAAGGSILMPRTEIPTIGWFAIFRDPGGLTQALYEDIKKPAARPRKAKKAKKAKRGKRRAKRSKGRRSR